MSFVFCKNCRSVTKSEDKYCRICGDSLEDAETAISNSETIRQQTFFCPKCNIENSCSNLFCENCNEDFSKYNIKRSFSETAKSRSSATKDALSSAIFSSDPKSAPVILKISCIISGIVFVVMAIISFLAFNVWHSSLAGLVPALFCLLFGVFWFTSALLWLVLGLRARSFRSRSVLSGDS